MPPIFTQRHHLEAWQAVGWRPCPRVTCRGFGQVEREVARRVPEDSTRLWPGYRPLRCDQR